MINCAILDDSPIAREILTEYCKLVPRLNVVASLGDAVGAREKIAECVIEILYVDINMPVLSGIELVRTLTKRPQVIFTTAYSEFAVEAFELSACDYLLKPFSADRFMVATDKAIRNISAGSLPSPDNFLFIRNERIIHRIDPDKILYLEASRNNTKVFTEDEMLVSTMHLSLIEKKLPGSEFQRVHRSFIVNTSKVTGLNSNRVFMKKDEVPLGENFKAAFVKAIGLDRL
jgi:DNA-binding LytR/AlgR family response regulator